MYCNILNQVYHFLAPLIPIFFFSCKMLSGSCRLRSLPCPSGEDTNSHPVPCSTTLPAALVSSFLGGLGGVACTSGRCPASTGRRRNLGHKLTEPRPTRKSERPCRDRKLRRLLPNAEGSCQAMRVQQPQQGTCFALLGSFLLGGSRQWATGLGWGPVLPAHSLGKATPGRNHWALRMSGGREPRPSGT